MTMSLKDFWKKIFSPGTAVISVILVVAFLVRLRGLGIRDFGYDEMFSVYYAHNPWNNWNAPLYWIALHFWTKIFGFSEFSLRFPGMLFSFSAIWVIYLLAKELFNKNTALLSAALAGFSAFHIWYAQDARDYSMFMFFGTLSSYLLVLALKKGGYWRWAWYFAAVFAGIYTNYYVVLLVGAQILYLLIINKFRPNRYWLFFLFPVLAFVLYSPRFLSKFKAVVEGFWIPDPGWRSFGIILDNYILGYSGTHFLYLLSSILILILSANLLLVVRRQEEARKSIMFCCVLLFAPMIVSFIFSKLFFSIFLNRSFLLFSPYFYLLISYAALELKKAARLIITGSMVITFIIGAYLYSIGHMYPPEEYHPGTHFTKPVKPLAEFLNKNVGQGDIIGFSGLTLVPGVRFYSGAGEKFDYYLFFDPQILVLKGSRPRKEGRRSVPLNKLSGIEFKRAWLVLFNREVNRGLDENAVSVKKWADLNLCLVSEQSFDNSWVYCYKKKVDSL